MKKFIHFQSLGLLLICFCLHSGLLAQTYKQQVKSTKIVSQIFEGKLKFNTKKTKKISHSVLQKDIMSNVLIPAHLKENVYSYLVPNEWDIRNWRGIIAEATADCGKIKVFIISISDADSEGVYSTVTIYIPPQNNCGKLLEKISPLLYGDIFEGKNIQVVKTNVCIDLGEGKVCALIVILKEAGTITYTPAETCNSNSDCNKSNDYIIPLYDLIMEKNK